jgi:hypothetical protein
MTTILALAAVASAILVVAAWLACGMEDAR